MNSETSLRNPRILIVIPCLNEETHLENLVTQLATDTKDLSALICIADGNSSDSTPKIAKALEQRISNVRYLYNAKRLQSAAVNLAVKNYGSDAEFLIRIDAHASYPSNFCHTLISEQLETGADSIVVSMHTSGENLFQRAVALAQNSKLGNGGSAHRNLGNTGKWVDHGHHALIRIEAFKKSGGYDEKFSHNEDAELDLRLIKLGYKIWLTAKTAMTYFPRSTAYSLFLQYYKFGKGRAATTIKHKVIPKLRQMLPLGVAPAILIAPLSLIYPITAVPFIIWLAICISYGGLIARKKENMPFLAPGLAAIVMHAGWSLGFWARIFRAAWKN